MPRGRPKKQIDIPTIEEIQKEINVWDLWDRLKKSEFGKFLINQIELAINETLDAEDKTDIYKMDSQGREYFFASVRSKRQTLKALRDKMLKAEEEKNWRIRELSKLQQPEQG